MRPDVNIAPQPKQDSSRSIKSLRMPAIILVILVILVAASGGIVVWQLNSKNSKTGNKAVVTEITKDLKDSKVTTTPVSSRIISSLGFEVNYDPNILQARGQVTDPASSAGYVSGESFDGDELETERPYSIIKFTQLESSTLFNPEMTIGTNMRAAFWDKFSGEPDFKNRKLELLTNYVVSSRIGNDNNKSASEPKIVKINGVDYNHIVLSRNNEDYGVKVSSESNIYVTVQNDRPYWVEIDDVSNNISLSESFNAVLATISYHKFDTSNLGMNEPSATLASVDLPEDTSNLPDDIDTDTVIPVVLQNQPAVVRILTIRCGSVVLSNGDDKLELPESCNGGVGSGSFISGDGYIATNGHVITVTNDQLLATSINSMDTLQKIVDFMVKAGSITEEQKNALIEALQSNDSSAQTALTQLPKAIDSSMISIKNDTYQYGIQTSNQPIRQQNMNISYDETVLEAKLIDVDYDAEASDKALQGEGNFKSSDVAILKVEGSFPAVKLASGSSLNEYDKITAIGYPAFVDDSISTKQWQTVPTVTQGKVTAIYDSSSYGGRLVGTTAKAAPGNSGGPAFNEDGEQGGLVTYSHMPCSDGECFGDGSLRDIEDIHKLVKKNNIELKQGDITNEWTKGLVAFADGNYQKALDHFDTVKRTYPANYLAPELSRIARSRLGSQSDTSNNSDSIILTVAVSVVVLGLIAIIILAVVMIRAMRARRRQVAQNY